MWEAVRHGVIGVIASPEGALECNSASGLSLPESVGFHAPYLPSLGKGLGVERVCGAG